MHDEVIDRFLAERAWLFELSLDPMVVGGFDGYVRVANGAFQRLVGLELHELLERPFLELVHPDDLDDARTQLERLSAGESLRDHPVRVCCHDGGFRWISWTVSASRAEKVFYAVGRDITERKEIDEFLSRQSALLELAHDAVIVCGADRLISFWNRGAERTYGWRREEAVGRAVHRLLHTVFPEPLEDIDAVVSATGEWEGELRHRRRDGTWIVVLSRWASRTHPSGRVLDMLEINRDITERKEAEERLAVQAKELARSNADLEQFASVVSHDLAQPLAVIDAYAQLLGGRYGERLDEEAKGFVTRIRDGTRHMHHLMTDLLAYCRLEHGHLRTEEVDCNRLVQEAVSALDVAIAEADAVVQVGDLPAPRADRTQLAQVFQNLVANAVRYSRPEVQPRVAIDGHERDGFWEFTVTDNGVGIPPEHRKKIFEMFERVEGGAEPGAGIGLAICARVVDRHGGHIWVEDAPGGGSRFCFTLPM